MKRLGKWIGVGIASALGLVLVAVVVIYLMTGSRFSRVYTVAVPPVAFVSDSATVAHGKHLSLIRGCVDCHGDRLEGFVIIDDPALGRMAGSNLTSGKGGVADLYASSADWARAIRNGIAPDGRPLLLMPSHEFQILSDEDVGGLIAYIESLPPVDHEPPRSVARPLGRLLYLLGQLPLVPAELIDHGAERKPAPEAAPTAEYGAYLASGCVGCHGKGYSGGLASGMPPGTPSAANLTPHETGLGGWSGDQFRQVLRTGIRPDGRELDPWMPWRLTAHMTDTEIEALWAFFQSLPPIEVGNL